MTASFAIFFWNCFLPGWKNQSTDFPNYYTAAVLTRQHAPLRLFYDWTWFQRQMNFAGVEAQLGGYIPQTPLTMLPVVPLSGMSQQAAKRWWLSLNLLFLAAAIGIVSKLSNFAWPWVWLLTFAGYTSLRSNFLLGQYYLLLLLLLSLTVYLLVQRRERSAGTAAGIIFGLKLYSAPFLLYFIARRRWRAAVWMLVGIACCGTLAVTLFGWGDIRYFAAEVLPRALQGETLDPFHPGNGTLSTLLRRTLVTEPELNPHPLFPAPALFFFLQPMLGLAILAMPLVSTASTPGERIERRDIAWFLIALLLASPNTASYTFVLLVLPVALLLADSPERRLWRILLPYALIGLPWTQNWTGAFPRLWLLLLLFLEAGRSRWGTIRREYAIAAGIAIALVSGSSAWKRTRSFAREPAQHLAVVIDSPGAIYSGAPVAAKGSLYFQGMDRGHYAIQRDTDGTRRSFPLDAEAFAPAVPDSGAPVYFEMVQTGASHIATLDPATGLTSVLPIDAPDPREPAVSHDGKTMAAISHGALFLFDGMTTRRLPTRVPVSEPFFAPDDRSIVFADNSFVRSLDLSTLEAHLLTTRNGHTARPSISPDGTRLLFATDETGPWQVAVLTLESGVATILTGGDCNNFAPAWSPSGDEIIFASDCGRGLGLPALYRLRTGDAAAPTHGRGPRANRTLPSETARP